MSVESGLSAPVDRAAGSPTATTRDRRAPSDRAARAGARRGPAAADALADAVSTPSFRTPRRGRPRRKGRRVRRVVRRIELWSVLKIALVFNTVMLGVALGAVAILWGLANTTGLIDDLEGFLRDSGFEDFRFDGDVMFQRVAFIGAVAALSFTVFIVLAVALVNLISEVTGGIRFVVIEEILEGDEPAPPASMLPPEPAAATPGEEPARRRRPDGPSGAPARAGTRTRAAGPPPPPAGPPTVAPGAPSPEVRPAPPTARPARPAGARRPASGPRPGASGGEERPPSAPRAEGGERASGPARPRPPRREDPPSS